MLLAPLKFGPGFQRSRICWADRQIRVCLCFPARETENSVFVDNAVSSSQRVRRRSITLLRRLGWGRTHSASGPSPIRMDLPRRRRTAGWNADVWRDLAIGSDDSPKGIDIHVRFAVCGPEAFPSPDSRPDRDQSPSAGSTFTRHACKCDARDRAMSGCSLATSRVSLGSPWRS